MGSHEILRALRGGPATLDALHTRLGAPEREALTWAVDEAVGRGLVHSSAGTDCGPDDVFTSARKAGSDG